MGGVGQRTSWRRRGPHWGAEEASGPLTWGLVTGHSRQEARASVWRGKVPGGWGIMLVWGYG